MAIGNAAQSRDIGAVALEAIDVSDPALYRHDTWHGLFERLRRDAPVHYCPPSRAGIWPSAPASIAASATGWPNCNCKFYGKKFFAGV